MFDPIAQNASVKRAIMTEVNRLRDIRLTVRPSETRHAVEIDNEIAMLTAAYEAPSLAVLVTSVRDADKAYGDGCETDEEEARLWETKQTARRALREAIPAVTGVNENDLRTLSRT